MSQSPDRRKEYPARMFNRATVVCPSCHQRFKEANEQCQRCGFDAYRVVQQFPYTPPVLERFIDNAGIADKKMLSVLNAAVDDLVFKFPQLGMYFCTVELDDPVSLTEFGFWMMNACPLQPNQCEEDRAWSILLLIDVKRGLASITPGYAIEAFMEDSGWEQALENISADLDVGNYKVALLDYVRSAGNLLRESAKQVCKKVN